MYQVIIINTRSEITVAIAVLAGVAMSLVSQATTAATFYVVPEESTVTFSGDIAGALEVGEQSPGSLTTSLTGTLEAEITPGFISFGGGSNIDLTEQAGPFLPGNLPADLAGVVEDIIGDIDAFAVYRDVAMDLTTSGLPIAVSVAGEFSTSSILFNILGGSLEFEVPGLASDSIPLGGAFDSVTPQTGTVEDLGGGNFRITIPYEGFVELFEPETGLAVNGTFTGQVVAVIPEPSTIVLLIMGALGLALGRFRRLLKTT